MKEKKKIYIYIDDERVPPPANALWTTCSRSYESALMAIKKYKNEDLYIDFDHDLGEGKTGYDIAKYLVENSIPAHYSVHSANPIGKFNIEQLLSHYGYPQFDFYKKI